VAVERRDEFHASERRRITTINQFLEYGADPTVIDMNGKTALHIFAEKSEWDNSSAYETSTILQAMIDSGGHLDQATQDGNPI
jgi:ankyrin repeat protein